MRLKISRPYGRAGSSPAAGTTGRSNPLNTLGFFRKLHGCRTWRMTIRFLSHLLRIGFITSSEGSRVTFGSTTKHQKSHTHLGPNQHWLLSRGHLGQHNNWMSIGITFGSRTAHFPVSTVCGCICQPQELNRPGFTGGQNSRRIARYGTCTKEEDLEAVFTRVP
jgi:hypothetical protein